MSLDNSTDLTCQSMPLNHGNGYPDFILASIKAFLSESRITWDNSAKLDFILRVFNMLNNDVWEVLISSTLLTFDSDNHNNQMSPFANDSPPAKYKEIRGERR